MATAVKYLDNIPTPKWVADRKASLGGSEVAAALGRAEYHKPIIIFRDDRFIAEMISEVAKWWNKHIVGGVRPDPVNGEDRIILFPESRGDVVVEATPKAYGD